MDIAVPCGSLALVFKALKLIRGPIREYICTSDLWNYCILEILTGQGSLQKLYKGADKKVLKSTVAIRNR